MYVQHEKMLNQKLEDFLLYLSSGHRGLSLHGEGKELSREAHNDVLRLLQLCMIVRVQNDAVRQ